MARGAPHRPSQSGPTTFEQAMTTSAEIGVDGLEFGYTSRSTAIKGLSVSFGPGKTILLGPNGAGKSTLLKVMCGLLQPRRGTVHVADHRCAPRQLARSVGFMPQDVAPLPGLSVLEAAEYGSLARRQVRSISTRSGRRRGCCSGAGSTTRPEVDPSVRWATPAARLGLCARP